MLAAWGDAFEDALVAKLIWRLGIDSGDQAADRELARALVEALDDKNVTIDRAFFDWRGIA
jgi:hypothetical protein